MILFSPIDAVGLGKLLIGAGAWLDEVTRHSKRKELFAGQTIYYLGTSVAALETLDNELRGLLSAFTRIDEESPHQDRADAFDRVNSWVHDFRITSLLERNIPALTDLLEHLNQAGFDQGDKVHSSLVVTISIASATVGMLRESGDHRVSEVFTYRELKEFWRALRDARTPSDIDLVGDAARTALEHILYVGFDGPRTAYVLPEAFGGARALALRKYPGLPRPAWSDPIV